MQSSSTNVFPQWTLLLPLGAIAASIGAPPERQLWSALMAAVVYPTMQWLIPDCRFRRECYFSAVNVALSLMLLKLFVVPMLIMTLGAEIGVISSLPSLRTMNGALAIDTLAYVALCVGFGFTPPALPGATLRVPGPSASLATLFAGLGLFGFVAAFGSVGRMMQYFFEPAAAADIERELEGTWMGLLGTVLRPFLAFSLVAWWSLIADRKQSVWRVTLAGVIVAIGITLANLTFNFNRAAFVFPLVALAAVYSSRIRRIPMPWAGIVAAAALPVLMSISVYRSNLMIGRETTTNATLQSVVQDASDNIQAYSVGPQYTGIFYDYIGWGERLFGGSTLIASLLSPVPVLGKGFRTTDGPALFNYAIYGVQGIEDQILPFAAELFANFHALGVVAGFVALGMLLGKLDHWFQACGSTFSAFALQYAAMWAAMLTTWSVSIFAQILIYFFGPIYVYLAITHFREFVRRNATPASVIALPHRGSTQ